MNTNELRACKKYRSSENLVPTGSPHIMNKNEAKVMRRLQSETGLSEEEIRQIKAYRIELSEAQNAKGPGMSDNMRYAKYLLKSVTRELKLAKKHPLVVEAAMKLSHDISHRTLWSCYSSADIVPCMKELLR